MTQPWQQYHHWHLMGIKGVAMTALAQCLIDAGCQVSGTDVADDFVTKPVLARLPIVISTDFSTSVPEETEIVVYTAAHQGKFNPQVQQATERGIPTISHAEALSWLFNERAGVAVCGVGGKSTTSAMIAWILEKTGRHPSYAIGVGGIPGLRSTGMWYDQSDVFVAEADEYVVDPTAPSRGEPIIPRFSYLRPQYVVCTNLRFDHPDVYRDLEHTLSEFGKFFSQVPDNGVIWINETDRELLEQIKRTQVIVATIKYFGTSQLVGELQLEPGWTKQHINLDGAEAEVALRLPGSFNILNAVAALQVTTELGVPLLDAVRVLAEFRSTKRRAEYIGQLNQAVLYDDYAHHPHEVAAIIAAFREWYPNHRLVVAFQSHTFSRTKALFTEFVTALSTADEVAMIDIFASAREKWDDTVSSDTLCTAINDHRRAAIAKNYRTLESLAEYLHSVAGPQTVILTVGAGTIYQVYEHLTGIQT